MEDGIAGEAFSQGLDVGEPLLMVAVGEVAGLWP
jgi:hypothetical protein